ncbi:MULTISPECIES: radical SAM/SPASM domain-containing protein [unclassified Sphaerochaeta]|jgi:uncharacterized protein|uniref:radical SAM/SPASM domain-containing protein n=2 Tax=Sphaerochaeta TaxID=399320 RepID=UPI000EEEF08A|nr:MULTISPECIES: SPASM domain-containing protein [unclassified Sphaerochaeta]HCU30603.1 anaerobic sulfatase maturase [Sphaerochaeta sp.]HPE94046.1 SPASM domain-containing protein [Sphaerochaeta sp.]
MEMLRNQLTMMIKPASAACNLACDYCFYLDTAHHREVGVLPLMKNEVADAIIQKSLAEAKHCSFVFQGGEPSLAGLSFFERFVEQVALRKSEEHTISYAFQTNGLKVDRAWARFFKKHDFLVGVSFDGSPRLHDLHRFDSQQKGSGRSVASALSLLKEEGVQFNVLSVVTNELAQNIKQAYTYLVNHEIYYHQYIACMDPLQDEKSYLSPDVYGRFLKELFDLWFASWQQGTPVSIRFFDNLVGMLAGYPPESCDMGGVCSVNYVVESNGDVYPCDFYCVDDQRLGNIGENSFAQLDAKRTELRFIEDSPNRTDDCATCQWRLLCRGGCKRYRSETGYKYCSSMQEFFPYAIQRLEMVARSLQKQ